MDPLLRVEIKGTGAFVPDEVLSNDFFARYLDTSDEWIIPRTGHWPSQRTSNRDHH